GRCTATGRSKRKTKRFPKHSRQRNMQVRNKPTKNPRMIDMTTRYVGIVAAPGAPDTIARKIKKDLPDVLAGHFEEDFDWDVRIYVDPLTNYAELTKELFQKTDEYYGDNDWDYTIFITDLPIYHNDHITAVDINHKTDVGVVSLPAYGWPPNKKGILDTIVTLITSVQADSEKGQGPADTGEKESLTRVFNRYFRIN